MCLRGRRLLICASCDEYNLVIRHADHLIPSLCQLLRLEEGAEPTNEEIFVMTRWLHWGNLLSFVHMPTSFSVIVSVDRRQSTVGSCLRDNQQVAVR